jgi:predicted extracellular nuclease
LARGWLESGSLSEQLRLGARTAQLTAVVLTGSPPTLLATQPVEFRSALPEPLRPRAGALRVAALNLDNYFVDLGLRGADSALELSRQRDKLVAALRQLDADILALGELETAPAPAGAADADLIAALNAQLPAGLAYALSEVSSRSGDIIHSALAYRPSRVQAGAAWAASAAELTRAPVFQTFEARGRQLTIAALHLKSKVCDGAQLVGPEGCGAETRLAEARALAAIIAQLPAAQAERLLLIGDFNSDSREAPSLELQRAGLSDLFASVTPEERYSYVFDGRATQLDHALGGAALVTALASAQIWHVDADEPELLDYHLDNPPELYRPDARRCSDHDPIVVDFIP